MRQTGLRRVAGPRSGRRMTWSVFGPAGRMAVRPPLAEVVGQRSSSGVFLGGRQSRAGPRGNRAMLFREALGHLQVLGVAVMTNKRRSFHRVSVVPALLLGGVCAIARAAPTDSPHTHPRPNRPVAIAHNNGHTRPNDD